MSKNETNVVEPATTTPTNEETIAQKNAKRTKKNGRIRLIKRLASGMITHKDNIDQNIARKVILAIYKDRLANCRKGDSVIGGVAELVANDTTLLDNLVDTLDQVQKDIKTLLEIGTSERMPQLANTTGLGMVENYLGGGLTAKAFAGQVMEVGEYAMLDEVTDDTSK